MFRRKKIVICKMTTMEDMYKKDLFIMGRSAMTFSYNYEVNSIIRAKEQQLKSVTPINWDIVTAPVDPNNRNQSSYFNLSNTFSVNASSPNLRASLEFVKYINSEAFAKLKSKSSNGYLRSWTAYNADQDGRKMEPFYKLEPKANTNDEYTKAPANFFGLLANVIKTEVEAVMADKKSVDEALQTIQEKGQEELVNSKKAEAAASASPSISPSPQ